MKPFITIQRVAGGRRQCLPVRDMTDCLLQAYDCVARRAYQKFVRRGGLPGDELEDWLNAERELLANLPVNVEDAGMFVSVLASLPGLEAEDVEVGIDPKWLVILGRQGWSVEDETVEMDEAQVSAWANSIHQERRAETTRVERARRSSSAMNQNWREMDLVEAGSSVERANGEEEMPEDPGLEVDGRELREIFGITEQNGPKTGESAEGEENSDASAAPSQLFCILELPAEVDPGRCQAVLASGLLGIRLPKRLEGMRAQTPQNERTDGN